MIYYVCGNAYDSEYLEHSGILGMKWGVRRYQNPDGTLTEAGKKRYYETYKNGRMALTDKGLKLHNKIYKLEKKISRTSSNNTAKRQRLEKDLKFLNQVVDEPSEHNLRLHTQEEEKWRKENKKLISDINKADKDIFSENDLYKSKDPKVIQKAKQIADVGLKALEKLGRDVGGLENQKGFSNDQRYWFWFEDQTIGLPQIVDLMMNKKWTASKIKKHISDVQSAYRTMHELPKELEYSESTFYFTECGTVDAFIDECEKIIKESK